MVEWGFTQSTVDTCLYTYTEGSRVLQACIWVDDVLLSASHASLRERFVGDLGRRFPIEDKGELQWILGLRVTRDRRARTLSLSQEQYVSDLAKRYAPELSSLRRNI